MAITTTITDSTGSYALPTINAPLSIEKLDAATDVVTLSNEMYTDFTVQKRGWVYPYSTLTEDEYNTIKGYYDRQFTLFQYPRITTPHYDVSDVPVRMYLNTQDVYNNCGSVENVEIRFRETSQLDAGSS